MSSVYIPSRSLSHSRSQDLMSEEEELKGLCEPLVVELLKKYNGNNPRDQYCDMAKYMSTQVRKKLWKDPRAGKFGIARIIAACLIQYSMEIKDSDYRSELRTAATIPMLIYELSK